MDKRPETDSHDRRQQRTQAALKQALLAALKEQPFEAITVQGLCERANVARKTFYEHYDDKDALLWATSEEVYDALQATTGDLDPATLLADGKPLTYPFFKHVGDHADFYRAMLDRPGNGRWLMRLLDYMAQASYERHAPLRAAAEHVTLPPELIAHHLAGAVLGCLRWWLKEGFQTTPEAMAYRFSQLAAPGVLEVLGLVDS